MQSLDKKWNAFSCRLADAAVIERHQLNQTWALSHSREAQFSWSEAEGNGEWTRSGGTQDRRKKGLDKFLEYIELTVLSKHTAAALLPDS